MARRSPSQIQRQTNATRHRGRSCPQPSPTRTTPPEIHRRVQKPPALRPQATPPQIRSNLPTGRPHPRLHPRRTRLRSRVRPNATLARTLAQASPHREAVRKCVQSGQRTAQVRSRCRADVAGAAARTVWAVANAGLRAADGGGRDRAAQRVRQRGAVQGVHAAQEDGAFAVARPEPDLQEATHRLRPGRHGLRLSRR
uniref:(northern house mosquito) hypothetical protein n=1 Tax=Culex pipiens TaxID=7175 RepID=A0A8D8AKG2_CULPI